MDSSCLFELCPYRQRHGFVVGMDGEKQVWLDNALREGVRGLMLQKIYPKVTYEIDLPCK